MASHGLASHVVASHVGFTASHWDVVGLPCPCLAAGHDFTLHICKPSNGPTNMVRFCLEKYQVSTMNQIYLNTSECVRSITVSHSAIPTLTKKQSSTPPFPAFPSELQLPGKPEPGVGSLWDIESKIWPCESGMSTDFAVDEWGFFILDKPILCKVKNTYFEEKKAYQDYELFEAFLLYMPGSTF